MESSIAVFLLRQSACELLPTILILQNGINQKKDNTLRPEKVHRASTYASSFSQPADLGYFRELLLYKFAMKEVSKKTLK